MTGACRATALALAAALLLGGCGSLQLPRALSPAERRLVETTSIPAVVGVAPSPIRRDAEHLRRILEGSGLFERVVHDRDLDRPPDLLVAVAEQCAKNPTTLVPMFTWMTLGLLPTWVRDGYGFSVAFFPPGAPGRRVVIGCGRRYTAVFGWVGTPLNVLPNWALTDPLEHPRYAHRLALEVAQREDELRALLEPP